MVKDVPRTEDNDDLNPRPAKRAKFTPPPSSPLSSCPLSQITSSQEQPPVFEAPTSTVATDPASEFSKLSPSQLLLSLPRILLHPPSHPLHSRSLHLSLLAFRRALSLPVLSPEEECRAWTGLAETGLRVVGGGFCDGDARGNNRGNEWAKGVEMEVEKAIGKGLLISQNHPSLRSYRHHLTILSAQLSIWQHSFKYAKSQLRRLVQTFLPSDPRSTVYGAWLELISTLATPHASPSSQATSAPRNDDTPTKSNTSVDSRKQDVYAAISAAASLRALAQGNDHEEICLLADVIRLRIIFERDSDQGPVDEESESELGRSLSACEQGLGLIFKLDAGPQSKPSSSTTADPLPLPKEIPTSTPLITSLRLQTLTLGILHHTQKGLASAAAARLTKLHALCDAGALDPIIPPSSASDPSPFDPRDGEGRVEVMLPARVENGKAVTNAERMWVSVPHPRCMLLLSYLVSATSKRDAVGRKPKRKMYASEGLNVAAKEDEAEILLPSWSSIADVSRVSTAAAQIQADLLSELIGISILRSDFSIALSSLDKLIAFTREHRLWDAYAPLVTLHHAHVAHALGKVERAEECYRVAAHIAGDRRSGESEVVAGSYIRAAARAGEAALRIGLARRESAGAHVVPVTSCDDNAREEERDMALALDAKTKALGAAVVKECRRMGGTLEAVGKVIESCLSTEILKSKECLRDALGLASSGQDNYLRALILALIGVHYLHTAGEHAHDVLETCEQLVAGLGASGDSKRKAGDPDKDKASKEKEKDRKGETDAVGNAPLRLWIGERFLEMYKRKGKEKKAQGQAAANKGYRLAVEKLSDI